MQTDNVVVRKSKINGKGVFAARIFKRGEVVLKWDTSHRLSRKVVETFSNDEKKYISFLNGSYVFMQAPEKYINHSCDANTMARDFCDITLRDINLGEEITANYTEELPPGTYMECTCGNIKCKKIIKS